VIPKPGVSTNHQTWSWLYISDHPLERIREWRFSAVGTLCRFQYPGHLLPWECYITWTSKVAWAFKRSTHHLWANFWLCSPLLLLSNLPLRLWKGILVLYLTMIGCENPSSNLPMNSESKYSQTTDGWNQWEESHLPRSRISRAITGSACFTIVRTWVSRKNCCERRMIRTRSWHCLMTSTVWELDDQRPGMWEARRGKCGSRVFYLEAIITVLRPLFSKHGQLTHQYEHCLQWKENRMNNVSICIKARSNINSAAVQPTI